MTPEAMASASDEELAEHGERKEYDRVKRHERNRRRAKCELDAEERASDGPDPDGECLTALLDEPDTPIEWRIENLLPVDETVVMAAQFKAGKTTATGNVLKSLADGEPLFGKFKVNPPDGRIAVLDFEMSKRMLKRWYRDLGIENTNKIDVYFLKGRASSFNILDDAVRKKWAAKLSEPKSSNMFEGKRGVDVLIIDCLRPILDVLGLKEGNEVGAFFVALDKLRDEVGAKEIIVVHHMGHGNERARGDSRIRDWPSVEWSLVRESEDPASARFFKAYGRDVDVRESKLGFDKETRQLTLVGGSRAETKGREVEDAVIGFLKEASVPPNGSDITRGVSFGEKRVRSALKRMVESGRLRAYTGKNNETLHELVPEDEIPF